LAVPALAGGKPKPAAGKPAAGKMDKGAAAAPAAKGAEVTKTGPVKGAVSGKMFTIAARGGDLKVDGSKAKVRSADGKFAKFDEVKPGKMVTVKGTMDKDTLKATDIQLPKSGGGKKPAGKTPA